MTTDDESELTGTAPSAKTAGAARPQTSGTAPADPTPPVDPNAALRRPATSLLTWATVALVLVIVVVLVVIKVTGGSAVANSPNTVTPVAASPAVAKAITTIPASVYRAVGVASTEAALVPLTLLSGRPHLTSGGKPDVVFVGNEFCPYCAAQRWALVAALSRFGTFGNTLYAMQSGSDEAFPGTPTFTFDGSRYRSRYIAATLVEHYGDEKNSAGTAYVVLERLSPRLKALLAKYDRRTPGSPGGVVPFVDVAGEAVVSGGQFSPSVLQQLSVTQIATGLTDPTDPATQAIVASANYLSAVICQADGQLPVQVCATGGVSAAANALGLAL